MDWDDAVDTKILGPLVEQFGIEIAYTPAGGTSFDVRGIYDKAFLSLDPDTGSPVLTNQPTVGIQLSQFTGHDGPQQGDLLTIKKTSEVWEVREALPDGHGALRLMLNVPGQTDV
ncbi:head-tail joining protein [Pandoraea sputorum]|uniref:head-tail joining protein n=1 Tax=Pandoraea sputorum TaxID=93222 RepID=UPI0012425C49|nr:hypothetical protein [Pandoraea sputorum]VVE06692.1 hypothetical protein PSP20601_02430 [Pandoraea sputorum]